MSWFRRRRTSAGRLGRCLGEPVTVRRPVELYRTDDRSGVVVELAAAEPAAAGEEWILLEMPDAEGEPVGLAGELPRGLPVEVEGLGTYRLAENAAAVGERVRVRLHEPLRDPLLLGARLTFPDAVTFSARARRGQLAAGEGSEPPPGGGVPAAGEVLVIDRDSAAPYEVQLGDYVDAAGHSGRIERFLASGAGVWRCLVGRVS